MDHNNYDTDILWRLLMILINSLVFIVFLGLAYLLLQDQITEFINRPSYSKEQLAELDKRREKQRIQERNENWNLVENGIHVKTGLKDDENLQVVIGACTSCHSAGLITQNRATRQGWKDMFVWMQETQGLPDLGKSEPVILDYLAKHYAPEEEGRRANLDMEEIEWYILNLEK